MLSFIKNITWCYLVVIVPVVMIKVVVSVLTFGCVECTPRSNLVQVDLESGLCTITIFCVFTHSLNK